MSCIGAPVFDVTGQAVAGVGITFLIGEGVKQRPPSWQRPVLETAAQIAQDIGLLMGVPTYKPAEPESEEFQAADSYLRQMPPAPGQTAGAI